MFLEKDVLKLERCWKMFSIFTVEHPCRSAISIKLQSIFLDQLLTRTTMEGCLNYKWNCSDPPITNFELLQLINPSHPSAPFWFPWKYKKKTKVENQIGTWQIFLLLFFYLILCLLINSILFQTQKIRV